MTPDTLQNLVKVAPAQHGRSMIEKIRSAFYHKYPTKHVGIEERSELRSSLRNFESQNEYGYKPCIKRRFQNAETLQSRNQTNSS